jgi:hypothetical protein
MVSSATNEGQGYIARHINQFDNYVNYYWANQKVIFDQKQELDNV